MEGRGSTSISHDVDFCWDPIPSRPCGSNLYQGVPYVLRHWDFYPVLVGEVECRSWVEVILIQHLQDRSFQLRLPGPSRFCLFVSFSFPLPRLLIGGRQACK